MVSELSPDVARFLPVARTIVGQIQQELQTDVDTNTLMRFAEKGLSEGYSQFRSRQGLTLRTYLIYRIQLAIYSGLTDYAWPNDESRRQYIFQKKSCELLLNFHLSAEGAPKRSTRAEQEEIFYLLRLLAGVALLTQIGLSNAPQESTFSTLDTRQQQFVQLYYEQDQSIEQVAERMGLSPSAANRVHLTILEKIANRLTRK
jgi:DNA-directed RNA polymerase specialized sigma subunit